jgi:integrase
VYRPKIGGRESAVWWLDYSIRGVRHRESSGTTSKRDALSLLRERIGKRTDGKLIGRPERVTLAELRAALEQHYTIRGRSSWRRAAQGFAHLEAFFGADCRVPAITAARVAEYQESRLSAGAARNSVKYETGVLNAAMTAAYKKQILETRFLFTNLPDDKHAVREGFFSESDFAALVVELPAHIADLVRYLRITGWRRGDGTGLMWAQVDWDDAEFPGSHAEPTPGPNAGITLSRARTKGEDARRFPIADAPELRELLLARWRRRDGVYVFHNAGKPIGNFQRAWKRACRAAGVPGRLVHDLRRTAAREFVEAGVSEGRIMRLCGWRTRAMFDRYNIVNQEDLKHAVARRYGKQPANTETSGAAVE